MHRGIVEREKITTSIKMPIENNMDIVLMWLVFFM